jgi:hypothetical protein
MTIISNAEPFLVFLEVHLVDYCECEVLGMVGFSHAFCVRIAGSCMLGLDIGHWVVFVHEA